MKKVVALALLCVLLVSLAACAADPNRDQKTIVVDVAGQTINRQQALDVYAFIIKQTIAYYAQYGYTIDETDQSFVTSVKNDILSMMAEDRALELKAESLGMGLTEADLAEIEQEATNAIQEIVAYFVSTYGATEEDALKEADAQGYTHTAMAYQIRRSMTQEKLIEYVTADVVLEDADLEASYATLVQTAKDTYASTPAQYGEDIEMGATIYFVPEGYRMIQNLVIGFQQELITEMTTVQTALSNAQYYLYMMGVEGFTPNESLSEEEKAEAIAAFNATIEENSAKLVELLQTGTDAVQPLADEILAKAKEPDADFLALMQEYSSDQNNGVLNAPEGYLLCAQTTDFVQAFTDAAMALPNVGDISEEAFSTMYGLHILKYVESVPSREIPMGDVEDAVKEAALTAKKEQVFNEVAQQWVTDAKIKTYVSKF